MSVVSDHAQAAKTTAASTPSETPTANDMTLLKTKQLPNPAPTEQEVEEKTEANKDEEIPHTKVSLPEAFHNEPAISPAEQTTALTGKPPKGKGRPRKDKNEDNVEPEAKSKRKPRAKQAAHPKKEPTVKARAKAKAKAKAKGKAAAKAKANTRSANSQRKRKMQDEPTEDAEVGARIEEEGEAGEEGPTDHKAHEAVKVSIMDKSSEGTNQEEDEHKDDAPPASRKKRKARSTDDAKASRSKGSKEEGKAPKASKKAKAPQGSPTKEKKTKGKEDDAAVLERKAQLSRKSCAYKKARRIAQQQGLTEEEVLKAAKQVACL